jgi:mono/diheme cytochrome c family protein
MTRMSGFTKDAVVLAAGLWLVSAAAPAAHAQDAKQLYEKNCVSCHGASGKGDGPASKMLKPPAADFATVLKGKADADIAKIIKDGGKAIGKSALMPAFASKLTDEQIKGVVELVKGFAAK